MSQSANTTIPEISVNFSVLGNQTKTFYDREMGEVFNTISFSLGVCITVTNLATLFCLTKYRTSVYGTHFWQQLLFLCLSDILNGIAISIFNFDFFFIRRESLLFNVVCSFGTMLVPTTVTLSVANCFMISVLRFLCIQSMSRVREKWGKKISFLFTLSNILIAVITLTISVVTVTIRYGFDLAEFCTHTNAGGQNTYKRLYFTGPFVLISLILLGTNIQTILGIVKLRRHETFFRKSLSRPRELQETDNFRLQITKRNVSAIRISILMVIVLNISTLPCLTYTFVSALSEVNLSPVVMEVVRRIMPLNSLFHPFLHFLRMTSFRKAVWKDIRTVLQKVRCFGHTE